MKKQTLFWVMVVLVTLGINVFVALGTTTKLISPPGAPLGEFEYWGGAEINFTCEGTPSHVTQNISNISLYLANNSQSWGKYGMDTAISTKNAPHNSSFTIFAVDGDKFVWNCFSCDNTSTANCNWGVNRSITYEQPPNVTLLIPADTNTTNLATRKIKINFSVSSSFTNDTYFNCRLWTNNSGIFAEEPLGMNVLNGFGPTDYIFTFSADGRYEWNVRCVEPSDRKIVGWDNANRTIIIDTAAPTMTMVPVDGFNLSGTSLTNLSYTVFGDNLDTCVLYGNWTGDWVANATDSSLVSGIQETFETINVVNGTIRYNIICNDTIGNVVFGDPTNSTFINFDAVIPTFSNVGNGTTTSNCTAIYVNWTTSEATNSTLNYGTATAKGTYVRSATRTTSHRFLLDFGSNTETLYYFNVSGCDYSNNCNTSESFSTTTPLSVCTGGTNNGWSAYAILVSGLSLSHVINNSGADYVYWWNNTGQAWGFNMAGTSAGATTPLSFGDAIFLYTATGTTYFRSVAVPKTYFNFSLISGNNLIGVDEDYDFNNFSATFNSSYTLYGWYNNSAQDYELYYWDTSWNNMTFIPKGNVVWVDSTMNVTWASNTSGLVV